MFWTFSMRPQKQTHFVHLLIIRNSTIDLIIKCILHSLFTVFFSFIIIHSWKFLDAKHYAIQNEYTAFAPSRTKWSNVNENMTIKCARIKQMCIVILHSHNIHTETMNYGSSYYCCSLHKYSVRREVHIVSIRLQLWFLRIVDKF